MKSKALERGGKVDTVKSCVRGDHMTDLIPALFFIYNVISLAGEKLKLLREHTEATCARLLIM